MNRKCETNERIRRPLSPRPIRPGTTAVLATLVCVLVSLQAPAADEVIMKRIDGMFSAIVSSGSPGAAVLVLRDGREVYRKGYGVADLSTLRRIGPQTNFRLASLTKQFTATAVMLLIHDGRLKYDTPLTDIFPGFPEYGKDITIRSLLNHTSGIPDYEDLMPKADRGTPLIQIQDSEVLDLLMREKAGKFPPGTHWDYSNSGYVVLGLTVAKVSGRPFGEFLRDRIFRPLQMAGTIAYQKGRNEVADRAFGHTLRDQEWRRTDQSPTSATLGDGGVYSSIADLGRWDRALREHTLLSETEMREAVTPVKVPDGSVYEPGGLPSAYGFGWFLNPFKGHARMWHYGETIGFRTAIQRFPQDNMTVVILCNRSDIDPTALALKIAGIFFDK